MLLLAEGSQGLSPPGGQLGLVFFQIRCRRLTPANRTGFVLEDAGSLWMTVLIPVAESSE
jgi:hypothetical protein